jgi:NAD(P)-dependent dehydrogenase (short-subunit alcohol dehydrogenase family)
MTRFEGRIAFVTGGASGIGLGIARALVARGVQVVIADLRPDHISTALGQFAGAGRSNTVSAIELDVSNRVAYAQAAEKMQADFGGVDILINNAGVGIEGPVRQATYADWDFGLGVNLGGVVNGLHCFVPQMLAHGRGGHIVNTSSLAATTVMPANFAIYAAGKAAVLNLSENLRGDLAEAGIGVSALLPGFVKTNIHQAGQNRPAQWRQGSGFAESEQVLGEPATTGWSLIPSVNWSQTVSCAMIPILSPTANSKTACANAPRHCWQQCRTLTGNSNPTGQVARRSALIGSRRLSLPVAKPTSRW